MPASRPFALTIAGLDPSGGAGILADIKTFEQHRVHGFAINTGNTIQTEEVFVDIEWTDLNFVLRSIDTLFESYPIQAVKIGIVPSLNYLKAVVFEIMRHSPQTKIVWDTVLQSTTGFNFLGVKNRLDLEEVLKHIDLITPNFNEAKIIFPDGDYKNVPCSILLKGGHNKQNKGVDYLISKKETHELNPKNNNLIEKHGSGCVLSSAIVAQLALGENVAKACVKAKAYTETFLQSNLTKLGNHYV